MSLLLMFSISVFMIFSNANGATEKSAPTAIAVTCGANETWNPCPPYCYYDEYCPKLIYGFIKDCPRPPPDWKCTGTCVCKPGFVRENGLCLSPTDACCTFPNTEFVQCNESICSKEKCVVNSTAPCKQNGCQCKAGFEYTYGTCTALPKCSDPNEEVVNCPNPCPGGTCTQPNFTSCSITTCKPYGCQCKKGYVKDKEGKCILLSQCPEPCGKNETWNPCPRYCYYDEYCPKLIYGYWKDCPQPPRDWECTGTCVCKPGLVRENGLCLTPTDACCPIPNTEFVECNRNNTNCPKEKCVVKSLNPCKQNGCQCKAGFIYTNGTCTAVPPKPCGANETWNPCPSYCSPENNCTKLLQGVSSSCTPPSDWKCAGKCECKPGFVRVNGTCYEPSVCCSDPNAELVKCPNPCPGGSCSQPNFTSCNTACKPYGCQCKQGFVKDLSGNCILQSKCPEPCGKNETWNPCPRYCYYDEYCPKLIYGYWKDCPQPPRDWECTGTCVCKPGLVRENGLCLTPTDACCPVPNTEFVECNVSICPKEKCVVKSTAPCKQNGCQCKAGFVYTNGTCTPLCPKPCSTNEICSACPDFCAYDDTCGKLLLGIVPACPVPPVNWKCSPKCMCKPGLIRENGTCSEPSVCCSDPNAEFVKCPNPCPGGTCNQPEFTPCKIACKPYGCQCKKGFVKDKDGKCIALAKCPKPCKKNEVWNTCPKYCSSDDTCAKLLFGIIPDCPSQPPGWQCTGKCECNPGFVRQNGSCTEPSVCCVDPNSEFVKCPNPCPGGTCAQPNFAPCKAACKPYGCQCKKGFVKNSDGKCVLLSECAKKCGTNEIWNSCVPFCTIDMTCSRLFDSVKIACKPPPNWQCSAGCICPDGFVRIDGDCVDKSACCPNPDSELVSCPNPCPGGTCEKPSHLKCNETCKPWGCQCKKGHVLNYKSEYIPLEKCPSCGANEHFDCGPIIDKNCTNLELDTDLSMYEDCVERCYCNKGFARNNKNICIPIADCKKLQCGENEVYIPCRGDCNGFYYYSCSLLLNGIRVNCPRPTIGQCSEFCECTYTMNGTPYVRINGKCRHPNECCTAPNTELVQCASRCPGGTCQQQNFTRCSTPCAPYACRCKKGFVTDTKGICIPLEQCPKTSTSKITTTTRKA